MCRVSIKRHIRALPREMRVPFLMDFVRFFTMGDDLSEMLFEKTGLCLTEQEAKILWLMSYPTGNIVSGAMFGAAVFDDEDGTRGTRSLMWSRMKFLRRKLAAVGLDMEVHGNRGFSLLNREGFAFPWATGNVLPSPVMIPIEQGGLRQSMA